MIIRACILLLAPLTVSTVCAQAVRTETDKNKAKIAILEGRTKSQGMTPIYVPGESPDVRAARHAQALEKFHADYRAEWNAKNPFKPTASMPKPKDSAIAAALRDSDAQALAASK